MNERLYMALYRKQIEEQEYKTKIRISLACIAIWFVGFCLFLLNNH